MNLTSHEWDMVLHALRTAAEMLEDTAVKLELQAEQLANEFRRRAGLMRALANRIEGKE